MTELDPVAVAVEAALTPPLAEAAAEVDAWVRDMARCNSRGWDFTLVGPAPDYLRVRLRAVRALAEHAYATGAPCDGQRCEQGGAAHCHRCAEVEADKLLAERDRLRDRLTAVRAATEEWHAFALEHRDDPDHAAQAAWRVMAHALCCVLTALDGEPGKKPCPDCQGDAVARETAERTPHSEESTHVDQ